MVKAPCVANSRAEYTPPHTGSSQVEVRRIRIVEAGLQAGRGRRRNVRRSIIVAVALVLGVAVGQAQQGASPEQQAALAQQDALEKATPQLQSHRGGAAPRGARPHDRRSRRRGQEFQGSPVRLHPQRQRRPGARRDGVAAVRVRSEPEVRQAVGPGQLRRVVRAHRPRRQVRQRVDDRRRLEHDRQVQPAGRWCTMVLGRKPEAIDFLERFSNAARRDENQRYPVGGVGTFNRPTDVAWDSRTTSSSPTATTTRASRRSTRTARG